MSNKSGQVNSIQRTFSSTGRGSLALGVLWLTLSLLPACAPAPTATPQPTATLTATDTPSPTPSPFPTSTATATNTPRPTLTPLPTATPTRKPDTLQLNPGSKIIGPEGSAVDANPSSIYEMVKINGQSAVVGNDFIAVRDASGDVYFAPVHITGGGMHQLNPEEIRVLLNQTPEEFGQNFPWMTAPVNLNDVNKELANPGNFGVRPGVVANLKFVIGGSVDVNSLHYDTTSNLITLVIDAHSSTENFIMKIAPDSALSIYVSKNNTDLAVENAAQAAFILESFFSHFMQMGGSQIAITAALYAVPHPNIKYIAPNVVSSIGLYPVSP